MKLHIKVDGLDAFKATLSDTEKRQIPFATANALNAVLRDGQEAVRAGFKRTFTLRRPDFINREGAKRIGPAASKSRLFVTFGTSDRADFLDKFETGEDKRPRFGGRSLAVPIQVRLNKRGIVPKGQRPRALTTLKSRFFAVREGDTDPRARHLADAPGIYGRFGRRRERLRLMYSLTPEGQIDPVLNFARTAERAVREKWTDRFAEAFAKALKTAR
jgi:hypothetical protein